MLQRNPGMWKETLLSQLWLLSPVPTDPPATCSLMSESRQKLADKQVNTKKYKKQKFCYENVPVVLSH